MFSADKPTEELGGRNRVELPSAAHVPLRALDIAPDARARQKGQKSFCLWFTGLSGAGKSTLANALDRRMYELGYHTFVLDGDDIRRGLNRDLGFADGDRVENIRRITEVARLMVEAGLITIVASISPFRSERQRARERFPASGFIEVFVDTPLHLCESRDVKGLYRRARTGQIKSFTGVDSPYEPPEAPEFRLEGVLASSIGQQVDDLISVLQRRRLIGQYQ